MKPIRSSIVLSVAATFMLTLSAGRLAAEARPATYSRLAPIESYLMTDGSAESALARSAAPPDISKDATIAVLGPHGYVTTSRGSNGFTCIVERGWMSPFDSADFWNPRVRGPICYNPAASRSVLLYTYERTKLVLAGLTKAQILDRIGAMYAAHRLPMPEAGAMSYMMSKDQYLGDAVNHWHPHLMFHTPKNAGLNDGASWGADANDSPVMFDSSHHQNPDPETIFMIPVGHWSDGSAAPQM